MTKHEGNDTAESKPVEKNNAELDLQRRKPVRTYVLKAMIWCAVLILMDRALFAVLKSGYVKYFSLDRQCEFMFVGNSRTALGVDHRLIEKQIERTCGKFALNGATSQTRFAMIQYLCQTQTNCSTVVLDVSAYSFNDRNLSSGAYTLLYPFMEAEGVKTHIRQHSRKFGEIQLRRLFYCSRFNSTTLNLAVRGLIARDDNLKSTKVNLDSVRHRIKTGKAQSMERSPDGLELFDRTVNYLLDHQKRIVLLYLPVVDIMNNVDRQQHDQNIAIFKKYAAENASIEFIDLNSEYESNYEIMYDGIHVNNRGKKRLSLQIAEHLEKQMSSN